MKGYKLTVESGKLKVIYMVQKIAPYLCQWKIESGKWKIVLNNFQLSIFNLEKGAIFCTNNLYINMEG